MDGWSIGGGVFSGQDRARLGVSGISGDEEAAFCHVPRTVFCSEPANLLSRTWIRRFFYCLEFIRKEVRHDPAGVRNC